MEKRKFKNLPSKIKTLIFFIGLGVSFLIGLVGDEFYFDFGDEFFNPFFISFIIYYVIAFFIGAGSYEGYKKLKDWIKKAVFGGGLLFSALFGLMVEGFYFDLEEDFFIPFTLCYIGIFVVTSTVMWIYDSYNNEK